MCVVCKGVKKVPFLGGVSPIFAEEGSIKQSVRNRGISFVDCPICNFSRTVGITIVSGRSGGAFFKKLINRSGVEYLGQDRLESAASALTLKNSTPISNLYILPNYEAGKLEAQVKRVRGFSEVFQFNSFLAFQEFIEVFLKETKKKLAKSDLSKEDKVLLAKYITKGALNFTHVKTVLGRRINHLQFSV